MTAVHVERWTAAFHGVQHLEGLPSGHQITLADHGAFTRLTYIPLHSATPWSSSTHQDCETVADAMRVGEAMARTVAGPLATSPTGAR